MGANTASRRWGVRDSRTPSSSTPAVCTTPVSGWAGSTEANTAASASRSATSQATTSTRASSSATSSAAPGAAGPRREVSSRCRTPCTATRWRASAAPRPPVPPVISTVPSGSSATGSASAVARARRGTSATPSRRATSGSPVARTCDRAAWISAHDSAYTSTIRSGCSACADRTRPGTPAWPGVSPVTSTSVPSPVARNDWISTSTWPVTSRVVPSGTTSTVTSSTEDSPAFGAGTQSTRNSESPPVVANRSPEIGRSARDSTCATGLPAPSATRTDTASPWPDGEIRARTTEAPAAKRLTPFQENGSAADCAPPTPMPCSTESSRAGCTPNPVAALCSASGSAASTSTSSPSRQAALRPWNTGP